MKRTILFTVLIGLIIIGCSEPASKNSSKVLLSELDTFYIGNKLVNVEKVSKSDFDKLAAAVFVLESDSLEKIHLRADSSFVKRNGDTLFLKISNGRINKFINTHDSSNKSEPDESYEHFLYLGFRDDIGQCIVNFSGYEEYGYYLIDKKTGDETLMSTEPIVSPDKKCFINSYSTENFNGLELYKNTHKPELVGTRELTQWQPLEIKWFNNSSLLVKASFPDTAMQDGFQEGYLKLSWKSE